MEKFDVYSEASCATERFDIYFEPSHIIDIFYSDDRLKIILDHIASVIGASGDISYIMDVLGSYVTISKNVRASTAITIDISTLLNDYIKSAYGEVGAYVDLYGLSTIAEKIISAKASMIISVPETVAIATKKTIGSYGALTDISSTDLAFDRVVSGEIFSQVFIYGATKALKKSDVRLFASVAIDSKATRNITAAPESMGAVISLVGAAILARYRKVSEMDAFTLSIFDGMSLSDVDMIKKEVGSE